MFDSMVVESSSKLFLLLLTYAFYIFSVLLLLRSVITRQELNFNTVGRLIGSLTSKYIPERLSTLQVQMLLGLVSVAYVVGGMFLVRDFSLAQSVPFIVRVLNFYMVVVFVSLIILSNSQSTNASMLVTLFRRVGQQLCNTVSSLIPIRSNVFYILVAFLFLVIYFSVIFVILILESLTRGISFDIVRMLSVSFSFTTAGVLSFLSFYAMLLFFRVLLSWFSPDPRNNFYILLYYSTESYLGFFRRLIPSVGMFDLSPIAALVSIYVIRNILILFL